MLNSHLKKGYHLNKNGEGCFGLEGKKSYDESGG